MSMPESASTQTAMPPAGRRVSGLSFSSVLAMTAASVSAWLRNPRFARWQGRLTGSVLLGLGVRLALARRD
jgi:threonine/homoserine/homoserine lactone efflux protein